METFPKHPRPPIDWHGPKLQLFVHVLEALQCREALCDALILLTGDGDAVAVKEAHASVVGAEHRRGDAILAARGVEESRRVEGLVQERA